MEEPVIDLPSNVIPFRSRKEPEWNDIGNSLQDYLTTAVLTILLPDSRKAVLSSTLPLRIALGTKYKGSTLNDSVVDIVTSGITLMLWASFEHYLNMLDQGCFENLRLGTLDTVLALLQEGGRNGPAALFSSGYEKSIKIYAGLMDRENKEIRDRVIARSFSTIIAHRITSLFHPDVGNVFLIPYDETRLARLLHLILQRFNGQVEEILKSSLPDKQLRSLGIL